MRKRVILGFDFDGVVIDNTAWGFKKINLALQEVGLNPVSETFMREHWGRRVNDLFAIICRHQKATSEQLAALKYGVDKYDVGDCKFDLKILQSLVSLKEAGLMIALITNRDRMRLNGYADKIGLDLRIFDHVQTLDDCLYHKPDGRVFLPLIERAKSYGLTAANIAYFGDTINSDFVAVRDIRRLGHDIKFIGVCSGINTPEDFTRVYLKETEIIVSHDGLPFYLGRIAQEAKRELIELF